MADGKPIAIGIATHLVGVAILGGYPIWKNAKAHRGGANLKGEKTMRDRLIELLKTEIECNKDGHGDCSMCEYEYTGDECVRHISELTADYLLANGVIVPPCKVGDSIYRVGNGEIWEWLIEHIEIYEDEMIFIDDSENVFVTESIGESVFLTKEEAEEKLKELGK